MNTTIIELQIKFDEDVIDVDTIKGKIRNIRGIKRLKDLNGD